MDDIVAVTQAQNGVVVYMDDVSQYHTNVSNFFDSISTVANTIVHGINEGLSYFTFLNDSLAEIYNSVSIPPFVSSLMFISLFFLLLNFVRNRGA